MATFIRPELIRDAITRLIGSRARSGLTDFLILKRALARCGHDTVAFSMRDEHFTGAIQDVAATSVNGPSAVTGLPGPFIKVFGTAGAQNKYIGRKMLTNGSADTLAGSNWRRVVRIIGNRPRKGGLEDGYETELAGLLLKSEGAKPLLADAAIWYHRSVDLETKLPTLNGDEKTLLTGLRDSFVKDLCLTSREIAELFDDTTPSAGATLEDGLVQETSADPKEYLPDLDATAGGEDDGQMRDLVEEFLADSSSENVALTNERSHVVRLAASLLAKRFLLLSGLAGSGKTKLAQAFARWFTPPEDASLRYGMIPVGADWTGNENILGYPDGLKEDGYVVRPALQLLLHAESEPESPHFLVLDEMNLSHVERYFADLLSAIESEEEIPLYEGGKRVAGAQAIPHRVKLPRNVFIIGTVNVDETTYMFSPKVLDRANVIEFRMERRDLESFLSAPVAPDLTNLDGLGARFGRSFVAAASAPADVPKAVAQQFAEEMLLFFDLLREHGTEFGFRVGHEASRFLHFYQRLGGFPESETAWFDGAFDAVIIQKLLPKLHGSRSTLEGLLWALAWACGADRAGKSADDFLKECREAGQAQDEAKFGPEGLAKALADKPAQARYPLSFDKVLRMWRKLVRDQFTSFAEA